MTISLLVPYRPGSHRDANWAWARQFWEHEMPEAEIVVADSGTIPFSVSASVNAAARQASGDVYMTLGVDHVCDPQGILLAAEQVRRGRVWAMPHTEYCKLRPDYSRALLASPPRLSSLDRPAGHYGLYNHSVATPVYSAEAFAAAGGMPECFRGWGGEDLAWAAMLTTFWGPRAPITPILTMFHLWHPVTTRDGVQESPYGKALWDGQTEDLEPLGFRIAAAAGDAGEVRRLLAEGVMPHGPDRS